MAYAFDTYHGSSGSPVLFTKQGEVVLLAVHRKSMQTTVKNEAGAATNVSYNVGSVLMQDFLARLVPNNPFPLRGTII